jgi:23S rRNA (adenine-N6)-dimethyltransferase
MDALLHELATGDDVRVGAPLLLVPVPPANPVRAAEHADPAELAGAKAFGECSYPSVEAMIEAAVQNSTCLTSGTHHRPSLLGGASQRLLAEDVPAGAERLNADGGVRVWGGADHHGIHVPGRDRRAPVGRGRTAVALGEACRMAGPQAHHPGDRASARRLQGGCPPAGLQAGADDRHAQPSELNHAGRYHRWRNDQRQQNRSPMAQPTNRERAIASRRRLTERDIARRTLAQNFVVDPRFAATVVAAIGPHPGELVLEIGAGRGNLTRHLLAAGCTVLAIESDPHWARQLRADLGGDENLRIIEDDVRRVRLPVEPYRSFGNIPFNLTTAIMRRLLSPENHAMRRADLLVQWEVARKHASRFPRAVNSLLWQVTFEFTILRRIPRVRFRPIPAVDAALLAAERRDPPLLPARDVRAFEGLLRVGFASSGLLRENLRGVFSRTQLQHLTRDLGLSPTTRGPDLDVDAWVRLFTVMTAHVPPERWPGSRPGRPG